MRLILLRLGLLPAALAMMLLLAQPFLSPRSAVAIADDLDSPFECPAPPSTPPTGTDACLDIAAGIGRIACDVTNPLFDSCTSSLVDFDPISIVGAALVGLLGVTGLGGVSFSDPKQCIDSIESSLANMLVDLFQQLWGNGDNPVAEALSSVFDPILKTFGSSVEDLVTAGANAIAGDIVDTILGIEPISTVLQCGCAIVGTAVALVNEGETAFSDTKQCVGAALAAVGSAAESIGESIECGLQHCITGGWGICPTQGSVTCDPGQPLAVCQVAYDQQFNMYNGQPFEFCPLNVVCAQGSPDPTTGLCTCGANQYLLPSGWQNGQYLPSGQCGTINTAPPSNNFVKSNPDGSQCVWNNNVTTDGISAAPILTGTQTQVFCCQPPQQVNADLRGCECPAGLIPDGQGGCAQPKTCPEGYVGTGTTACTQVCTGTNQVAVFNDPGDPSLGHKCLTCDNATQIDFGNSCKSCPPGTTKGFFNDLLDTCGPICDGGTTWNPSAAGGAGACQPCNNGGVVVVSSQAPTDGGNGAIVTNSCSCPSGGQQGDGGCPTQAQLDAERLQAQQSIQKALQGGAQRLGQGTAGQIEKNPSSAVLGTLPQCPPGTSLDSNNNCNPQCGGDQAYDVSTGVCSSCAGGKLAAAVVANSGGGLTTQKYCFCPSGQPPGINGCGSGTAQTPQISLPDQGQSVVGLLRLAGRATPMLYSTCAPLGSEYVVDGARQDQCHRCSTGSYPSANHSYCLTGNIAKGRFAAEVGLFGPRPGATQSQPMLVNANPTARPGLIKGSDQGGLTAQEMLLKQQGNPTAQEMLLKQGNPKTQEPTIEGGKKGSPTTQEMLKKQGGPKTQEPMIEGGKKGSRTTQEILKKQGGQTSQEMQIQKGKQGGATTQEMMIKQNNSKPVPNVQTPIKPTMPLKPIMPPPPAPHPNYKP